ncbi:anhydro-N-acetylmuramic acid kinase [Paenibacillus albicereus]|uniref:Anhydro-N-acetylmuramic acid kinase n=1 Tax=Paenibacillus albicereus TaxID=2726185 RepID=A0A6H2GT44_9BACL|nr:anhydro-N-acetylmuramic acid kinase [Paenibacillus albicereus]QJC50318.1 anhydro-N-acetylmuramic acid kinase [Paenibacillus albicereus]
MLSWRPRRPYALAVGLMSGTSLDGVDAAVVRFEGEGLGTTAELLHFHTQPYDEPLREALRRLCEPGAADVQDLCGMNAWLGGRFAEAARAAVSEAGLAMADIDFVSSHGQTVWHMPEPPANSPFLAPSTLQLGDLSVLAARTGVPAVGDFRPADMAHGGQGAPLVPYGDLVLLRHPDRGRLLQNIGGIGNCTVLPAGAGPDDVAGFDTGPGNMVIDRVVQRLTDGRLAYDADGALAAQGTAHEGLLAELLAHPYFVQPPPKSTGRELFGSDYAAELLARAESLGLSTADAVATATALTARSIADALRRFVLPHLRIDEVIVSGGGARNRTLMRMLAERLPEQRVADSGEFGLPGDAKEAVLFALLGYHFLLGIPNSLPSVTGASRAAVMGKLALP